MSNEIITKATSKMEKVLENLENEFSAIRAGRANPAVLSKISVDYYGAPTPISGLASVSVSEARILIVQPYDASSLKAIEKAILASDIGINPTNDGKVLRIVFPQLTEERRKELVKQISKYSENAKVAVRNVRRDALDKFKDMKKKSEITEDDMKTYEKQMQKLTDKNTEKIEKVCADKEKEVMTV